MIDTRTWNEVSTEKFIGLPAGGYVCKIINVRLGKSQAGNETLYCDIDIAEGDFIGHFAKRAVDLKKRFNVSWSGDACIKLGTQFNGKLSPWLKKFLQATELSNAGFKCSNMLFDERNLVGKFCGFVFRQKESKTLKDDGTHYINTVIDEPYPVDDIRNGKFTVPEIERYVEKNNPYSADDTLKGEPVDDKDLPF